MDRLGIQGTSTAASDPAAAFVEHFGCPQEFAPFRVAGPLEGEPGYFRFASTLSYGKIAGGPACKLPADCPRSVDAQVKVSRGDIVIPFDATETVDNFRCERYTVAERSQHILQSLYYGLRPVLPAPLRRFVHQAVSKARRASSFPHWPLDCSVEQIFDSLMQLALRATGDTEIPFVWFWPDGHQAACIMTHDVEGSRGAAHCDTVMDLDEHYGIRAAFQVIPQKRYSGFEELVGRIRARGFEPNLHDLDHDGRLYENLSSFRQRAGIINEHGRKYGLRGFRAGSMHRRQEWFHMLEFDYDMSVPNVAHLEPQSGGCCTVMPYFIGDLVELPLTMLQDYALFFILGQKSIDLWKEQMDAVLARHGLISFIVHPDYIMDPQEHRLYCELLEYLASFCAEHSVWMALPREINQWWRQRSRMQVVRNGDGWQIVGNGRERARLAFAQLVDGRVKYRLADAVAPGHEGAWPDLHRRL